MSQDTGFIVGLLEKGGTEYYGIDSVGTIPPVVRRRDSLMCIECSLHCIHKVTGTSLCHQFVQPTASLPLALDPGMWLDDLFF